MSDNKKILAIETSGKTCSIALTVNDVIQAEYTSYEGNQHDKLAAEFCRRILNDNNTSVNDLAAVAVSIGPGSFTGLRIGTAIAKGMTIDNNPKLIAVPTLSALALNAACLLTNVNILALIPSHADMWYCQEFSFIGEPISDIIFTNYETINQRYNEQKFIIISNQRIDIGITAEIESRKLNKITASMIAKYAYKMYGNGMFADPINLVPLYVQEFLPKSTGKK